MTPNGDVVNEREKRHGRRLTDRLVPLLAVMVVVLMAICTVLSVVAFSAARDAKHNSARLDAAVRGGCERLQRLRDDVNVQADGQYDVIKLASSRVPEPFATLYRRIARETPYSPPTDCNAATVNPLRYKPPPLIPWSQINACFDHNHQRITSCPKR